jgi:hypothetical protein
MARKHHRKKISDEKVDWSDKPLTLARPGRGSDQFMVRLPDGMRDTIAKMAERNGRSMNAEIVSALADHIVRDGQPSKDDITAALTELRTDVIEHRKLFDLSREILSKMQNTERLLEAEVRLLKMGKDQKDPPA